MNFLRFIKSSPQPLEITTSSSSCSPLTLNFFHLTPPSAKVGKMCDLIPSNLNSLQHVYDVIGVNFKLHHATTAAAAFPADDKYMRPQCQVYFSPRTSASDVAAAAESWILKSLNLFSTLIFFKLKLTNFTRVDLVNVISFEKTILTTTNGVFKFI